MRSPLRLATSPNRSARLTVALLAVALANCASRAPRPETPSLECMQAAISRMPESTDDSFRHCLATGLITRYCSASEAVIAGVGKELRDLFGRGDASLADLRADRRGLSCARQAEDDAGLLRCCEGGN